MIAVVSVSTGKAVSSGCGSSGEGITRAKYEKNSQMRMIIKVGKKPKKVAGTEKY
ncbi:hypothetical protein [Photorhabdus viridis]|uniref:hypothetical protein n=1 Tax=Photorhabdus viridis TaxID=3163327 RepID=UPI00330782CE